MITIAMRSSTTAMVDSSNFIPTGARDPSNASTPRAKAMSVAVGMRALGWAKVPDGMDLRAMIGLGLLCGIGFTMSLFIASLGYRDPVNYEGAVLGVLCASVIAALLGYGWLRVVLPAPGKTR